MSDNWLEDVNRLIDLGVGDKGRLEHIKDSLQNNKTLYDSDKDYLQKLKEQYLKTGSVSEKHESSDSTESHTENSSSTVYCTKCGNKITSNSHFCPNCGTKVEEVEKDRFCGRCGKQSHCKHKHAPIVANLYRRQNKNKVLRINKIQD